MTTTKAQSLTPAQYDMLLNIYKGRDVMCLGIVVLRNLKAKGLITYKRSTHYVGHLQPSHYRYTCTVTQAGCEWVLKNAN